MSKIKATFIVCFLFLLLSGSVFSVHTVYVVKKADFFKCVEVMLDLKKGATKEGRDYMVGYLLDKGYIEEITPQIARSRYNIEWIENDSGVSRLIIADMESKVAGSGLFTIDPQEKDTVIAEYLGSRITKQEDYEPNAYSVTGYSKVKRESFLMIDALVKGGAARFAQHAPNEDEQAKYHFQSEQIRNSVATPNSNLILQLDTNGNSTQRVFLVATKKIEAFRPIFFCYKNAGGYGYPHHVYPDEPLLFYKNWNSKNGYIIPSQEYSYEPNLILFEPRGKYDFFEAQIGLTYMSRLVLERLFDGEFTYYITDQIWWKINYQELKNQLSQSRSRLSVRGIILNAEEVAQLRLNEHFQEIFATQAIQLVLQAINKGQNTQNSATSAATKTPTPTSVDATTNSDDNSKKQSYDIEPDSGSLSNQNGGDSKTRSSIIDISLSPRISNNSYERDFLSLNELLLTILHSVYDGNVSASKDLDDTLDNLSKEIDDSEYNMEQKERLREIIRKIKFLLGYLNASTNRETDLVFTDFMVGNVSSKPRFIRFEHQYLLMPKVKPNAPSLTLEQNTFSI